MRNCCFFILAMCLIPIALKAQDKGELRLYYGTAESGFITFVQVEGIANYGVENFQEYGVRYIFNTSNQISFASGINFLHAEVAATPAPGPLPTYEIPAKPLNIISVPLLVHLRLGRYFFVNGGPLLDFQLNDSEHDLQSGFGFTLGVGANYVIDRFVLFANPKITSHALIPFVREGYHQRLTEIGFQIGVGYQL